VLLFTPSQIALAAVMYAVDKAKVDAKDSIREKLFEARTIRAAP
jgi:hypothetical protein